MLAKTSEIISVLGEAIGEGPLDYRVASFLRMTTQALSNHKSKNTIPYKNIIDACLFLNWPVNDLLTQGNGDEFLGTVAVMKNKKIREEDGVYDFNDVVLRIKEAIDWIHENYDESYLVVTGKISGNDLDKAYAEVVGDMFYTDEAIEVIFQNSDLKPLMVTLVKHAKLSEEQEKILSEQDNLYKEIAKNTEKYFKTTPFPFPSKEDIKSRPRYLDRLDLWKFSVEIYHEYYRDFLTWDVDDDWKKNGESKLKKFADVYYILGDPLKHEK